MSSTVMLLGMPSYLNDEGKTISKSVFSTECIGLTVK